MMHRLERGRPRRNIATKYLAHVECVSVWPREAQHKGNWYYVAYVYWALSRWTGCVYEGTFQNVITALDAEMPQDVRLYNYRKTRMNGEVTQRDAYNARYAWRRDPEIFSRSYTR